jgi:hypothetical protein
MVTDPVEHKLLLSKGQENKKQKKKAANGAAIRKNDLADIAWKSGQLNTGNAPACKAPPPAR